jgi:hypothetical protein
MEMSDSTPGNCRLGPGAAVLDSGAGITHDWWNVGTEETLVRIEVSPAHRFEQMILNLFGLAQDGKVNQRGMPNLLQLAVFAREFDDVVRFTRPPRHLQRMLFPPLESLARWLGYRGSYAEYLLREPSERLPLIPIDIAEVLADRAGSPLQVASEALSS